MLGWELLTTFLSNLMIDGPRKCLIFSTFLPVLILKTLQLHRSILQILYATVLTYIPHYLSSYWIS